jgi:hypothetical protein
MGLISVLFYFSGKNKRVGKQLASQKILQMLHPHVKNWGSLLRMYGRESNKMVKKVRTTCTLGFLLGKCGAIHLTGSI